MSAHSSMPSNGEQHISGSSSSFLPENEIEVTRLLLLHRRLSELMGGILPPGLDLSQVHRVLDVACGVGGWAYDIAWRYPDIQVTGVDTSAYFIEQARMFARERVPNVTYLVRDMHALGGEVFAPEMFDLVHLRFLVGKLAPQAFPGLIRSLIALCRPGGWLVWTEMELPITTSAAFQRLCALLLQRLQAAGRAFTPGNSLGVTALMGRWLRDAGCRIAQDKAYGIEVSAGMKAHDIFMRQVRVFMHQVRSFLLETGMTATEFEEIFEQVQREISEEAFCGICYLRTLVGVKQEA